MHPAHGTGGHRVDVPRTGTPRTGTPQPLCLTLRGRALLLVAGLPGAGKSTLLAGLAPDPRITVLDSDAQRAALRRVLPAALRYAHYRWLVHLLHRSAAVAALVSGVPVVVVHLPATAPAMRTAVARLAALTGRSAHLLWLDVDAEGARAGQRVRGRIVPETSFTAHAQRAAGLAEQLRSGAVSPGWSSVTVLDRARARGGLRLRAVPPGEQAPAGPQ